MNERVVIVGLMRFSIVLNGSVTEHWRLTKGRPLKKIARTVLAPKRLAARLRLAQAMPIASLARQTDPDFQLCILISTLLPASFGRELAALAERYPFIKLVLMAPNADLQEVCAGLVPADRPCVTFRLDDDDAVGPHFIADLRAMATPAHEERVISFIHGVQMERRGPKLAFQELEYRNNAFGLSYYSRAGVTIFDQGGHHSIDAAKIVDHPRPRAWIRSIHADSDSASRFRTDRPTWEVQPAAAAGRLPEYATIDFEAVAPDLTPFNWKWAAKRRAKWKMQQAAALILGKRDGARRRDR